MRHAAPFIEEPRPNCNTPADRLLRAQNDDAFAAYIIHPLIVVSISLAVAGFPLHPVLKLAIVSAVAVPACFAAAWLLRRIPGTARVL